jgi:peroxin-19
MRVSIFNKTATHTTTKQKAVTTSPSLANRDYISRIVSGYIERTVLVSQSNNMNSKEEQAEIEKALDAALDELDDDEDDVALKVLPNKPRPKEVRPFVGPPRPPQNDPEKAMTDMLEGLLGGGNANVDDPEQMMRLMEQMQSQIQEELQKSDAAEKTPHKKGSTDVDHAISSLVEGMAKKASLNETPEEIPEAKLLEDLMKGFDGGDFNADEVIDGMMESLMAKELMYEPMNQVALKFPSWLEKQRNSLSEKEYME